MAWTFTVVSYPSEHYMATYGDSSARILGKASDRSYDNSLKDIFWTLYYTPFASVGGSVQKTIGMCCTKISLSSPLYYYNQGYNGANSSPPVIEIARESTVIAKGGAVYNAGSSYYPEYRRTIPAFTITNPNHGSYDLLANTHIICSVSWPSVATEGGTLAFYYNIPEDFVKGRCIGTAKQGGYTCKYFNLSGLLTIMIPNSDGSGWTGNQETQGSYIKSGTDIHPSGFQFHSYPGNSTARGTIISSSILTTLYQGVTVETQC